MVAVTNDGKVPPLPCPICWSTEHVEGFAVEYTDPRVGYPIEQKGFHCENCDNIYDEEDVQSAGLIDDDGYVLVDLPHSSDYLRGVSNKTGKVQRGTTRRGGSSGEIPTFGKIEKVRNEES
jgi:hypothetical protein